MHHRVDLVRGNHVAEPGGIVNVAVDNRTGLGHGIAMAGREIVVNDDPLTARGERLDGMAADVSGSAGDEDPRLVHGRPMEK